MQKVMKAGELSQTETQMTTEGEKKRTRHFLVGFLIATKHVESAEN